MDIQNLKYNVELIKTKTRLEKELKMVKSEITDSQEKCNHIRVCLGWNGRFQYRDTSINECLLCGDIDPYSIYETIDATKYKKNIYGHGQQEKDRESRMSELRELAIGIIQYNPTITEIKLIEKINQIIEKDQEQTKKLEKIYNNNHKY